MFAGNPDLTVIEALDRAAARIGERFQDQPLVEAAIQMVIGQGYRRLGKLQQSVTHLERAVTLRKAHLGPEHPDTLTSMSVLAEPCSVGGRHDEAIALCQQLLESTRARLGPDHPETLACVRKLAEAYRMAARWDMSISLLEQTLEKQRRIFGPTHPETHPTMHQPALNYYMMDRRDRLEDSMDLHQKILDAEMAASDPEAEPNLWLRMTFAQACQRAGKLDRADHLLHEVLEHNQKRADSFGRQTTRRQCPRLAFSESPVARAVRRGRTAHPRGRGVVHAPTPRRDCGL